MVGNYELPMKAFNMNNETKFVLINALVKHFHTGPKLKKIPTSMSPQRKYDPVSTVK